MPTKGELESVLSVAQSQSFAEENEEGEEKTPVYDPLTVVDTANLPDLQKNNLKAYIQAACEKLDLSEQAVMIRMMAYAYDNLAVKGGLFSSGLDGVGEEVLSEKKLNL